ncbi:hypothetical protein NUU61_006442 [Penicillium alfredii]|uniref:Spindle pole body component n=1 Tax=Penicillium alfredii TaxID=1506179 RepID=A0A9W9F0X0_9EURO|nr:uncharacterized protein NUU61_006442 [Penicillium alfredii]KAJ5091572.1 hypothetical protein NUU61_006442 [Penicillium alfredii]
MDSNEELDPFSSEGLWRLSKFSVEALKPIGALPWNADLPDIPRSCFHKADQPIDKPDPIWSFNSIDHALGPLESTADSIIDPSIDSQSDTSCGLLQQLPEEDDGLWGLDLLQEDVGYVAPLKTWERYYDPNFREPPSAYLSEWGPRGFDAALECQAETKGRELGRLVHSDVLIRSLLRLGLGWSSVFFRYDQKTNRFERPEKNIRVSGVSPEALESVIENTLRCGTDMLHVRSFVRTPPSKCKPLSSLFALGSALAVVIYTLEQKIVENSKHIVSPLQILALFRRCGDLIGALASIVDAAERAVSDAQVISTVMERAAFLAQKFAWLENLVHEIVVRVAAPWFTFIEGWIGLRPEESALKETLASGNTFVHLETVDEPAKFKTGPPRIDYTYRADHMPSLIPDDQAQSIFENGRSLRLLKRSHPQHPVARDDVLARAGHIHLYYATTWADIERIQRRAHDYEAKLRSEILRYHSRESSEPGTEPKPTLPGAGPEAKDVVRETFELFNIDDEKNSSGPITDRTAFSSDKFNGLLDNARSIDSVPAGNESRFGPELSSGLYLSLAPVIFSQSLLIDFSCLHHLFKEHRVRHHLHLQWRFQLLGDGTFVSRLLNSLFDPEMESSERKSGVVRSGVHTGLRLGSRDTWPPASSELRLVLIGLLGDCYFGDTNPDMPEKAQSERENELPGGLSFSIRELTNEEITRCKNPNAIEALDFLRLQYKPPEVLETIITSRSLDKYDRLFKHLLRLLRMLSVVKGIVRDSTVRGSLSGDTRNVFQKFRVDAQHFVLAVSDYCFHIGIGSIWHQFQETLTKIEYCLDRGDIDGTIEAAHSVPRLRDYHEDILDQMLFAFFLSKRHVQAAHLLDSIFGTILAFSPLSRADGLDGLRQQSEGTVLHLYTTFRKQTSAFVGYLRSLDSGKSSSKSMGKTGSFFSTRSEPTSVFEHLLARLDMKEYY